MPSCVYCACRYQSFMDKVSSVVNFQPSSILPWACFTDWNVLHMLLIACLTPLLFIVIVIVISFLRIRLFGANKRTVKNSAGTLAILLLFTVFPSITIILFRLLRKCHSLDTGDFMVCGWIFRNFWPIHVIPELFQSAPFFRFEISIYLFSSINTLPVVLINISL